MDSQGITDIILVTHNNLGRTIACIESVYEHTQDFHLTVVDDSTDLTEQYIKSLKKDNLTYLRPDVPLAECNQVFNIGFENTKSEFVVGLTNSSSVDSNWLQPLLKLMEQAEDAAIIQPKHLFPVGTIENAGIYFQEPMMHHMNYGVGDPAHRWTHIRTVDAVGFCCVLFRRSAVYPLPIGYYIGFNGFDDVDTCFQLREKGWKIYYCGYSAIYHYAHSTRGNPANWTEETIKKYDENRFRFLTRWANWGEFKKEEE